MDEKERKESSDIFWALMEHAQEAANQLEVDEPLLVLPERESVH